MLEVQPTQRRSRGSIDNPATRSDGAGSRPKLLLSGDIGYSDQGAGSGIFLFRSIALLLSPVAAEPANPQSPAQAEPSHWFSMIQTHRNRCNEPQASRTRLGNP